MGKPSAASDRWTRRSCSVLLSGPPRPGWRLASPAMGSYPITRAAVDDAVRYADRWLAFRQRATPVPGVQAAVWFDGELVLSTAHGVADEASGEALTAAHRFRIASHSKTMTATVLAQMVEEGHLRLDDPVGTRLDWLHDSDSPVADLTLFQLLAHAGGIPRDSASSAHWQHEAPFLDADTLAERVLDLTWPEAAPLRSLLTGGDRLRRPPRPGLPLVRAIRHADGRRLPDLRLLRSFEMRLTASGRCSDGQ